jgi:hypothetical protein
MDRITLVRHLHSPKPSFSALSLRSRDFHQDRDSHRLSCEIRGTWRCVYVRIPDHPAVDSVVELYTPPELASRDRLDEVCKGTQRLQRRQCVPKRTYIYSEFPYGARSILEGHMLTWLAPRSKADPWAPRNIVVPPVQTC